VGSPFRAWATAPWPGQTHRVPEDPRDDAPDVDPPIDRWDDAWPDVPGPSAVLQRAYDLRESGRQLEAWHWAQVAADAGDQVAAGILAAWRWDETRDPALEPQLRAGARHHPHARASLSHLLRTTGRIEDARGVLEEGALRGEVASWLPLGNLYRDELSDDVAAAAAYRAGIDGGDLHSHHNLGVLLLDAGDVDGAIEHFSIAAAGGDELAARVLREVLAEDD
jgi:hypothetical protein